MGEVDYFELMRHLSRPRLSGSPAEAEVRRALCDWLARQNIAFELQAYTLRPYFFFSIGVWLICTHSLLALSIWLGWGWVGTLAAILGVTGGLVDVAFNLPLITWPGKMRGENLLVEFAPAIPERELVISAHIDSKTELYDHHTRLFFVKNLRLGILLAVLLGCLSPLQPALALAVVPAADWVRGLSVLLTLPLLFLAWGLGLNLALGRLRQAQSQGAVDNGAACAILLGLAHQAARGELPLQKTRLTLAFFGGEEVNMQGSRAYTRGRPWALPCAALNLEVMAQDGEYVFWEQDGTSLKVRPTDTRLNQAVVRAVTSVTGSPAIPVGPINSDGCSFLQVGVPVTTLGTYDRKLRDRGFHLVSDNLDRVQMWRLPEGVAILKEFIGWYDR